MEGMYNYKVDKVVSVYDGDTMTVDIDLGFNTVLRNRTLRFYGINTPELRGGTDESKAKGYEARDYVREMVEKASEIFLTSHYDKSGKYGRILATVITVDAKGEATDINQALLEKELAVEYMKK